jgi:hypothetical protein
MKASWAWWFCNPYHRAQVFPADKIIVRPGRFPEEAKDLPFALGGAFQFFNILGVPAGRVNLIPRI